LTRAGRPSLIEVERQQRVFTPRKEIVGKDLEFRLGWSLEKETSAVEPHDSDLIVGDLIAPAKASSDAAGTLETARLFGFTALPSSTFVLRSSRWKPMSDWSRPLRRTASIRVSAAGEQTVPQLSPDGAYVAYQSNESGRFEVYVKPFPGRSGSVAGLGEY
jgi:hypothetical protein